MIFVTVGTTLPFDALIETVDKMAGNGDFSESVVCQIGHGRYEPKHCEYFRFSPEIDDWIQRATLVIGHGGTGTVSSLLAEAKPFVAVANPAGADDHQGAFLARLSQTVSFLWTKDLSELQRLVTLARSFKVEAKASLRLVSDLRKYLLRCADGQ